MIFFLWLFNEEISNSAFWVKNLTA